MPGLDASPSLFVSTASTTTLRPDPKTRIAQGSFTVSNTSDRPLRGRARVVPQDSAPEATLVDPEREFAGRGTQQFTFQVLVPAGAAAGSHRYETFVAWVDDPDDHSYPGPTFTLEALHAEERKRIPWWVWVIPVVLAVLVAGGLVAWQLWRNVTVPNVVGTPVAEASNTLTSKGLGVGSTTEQATGRQNPGTVLDQDPDPGQRVPRDTSVDLVVEAGRVDVPKVVKEPIDKARATLTGAGLRVARPTSKGSFTDKPGTVLDQDPDPGRSVPLGTTVKLVVAAAPKVVKQGQLTVTQQGTIDLDDGVVKVPTSTADIWFNTNGGSLDAGLDNGHPFRARFRRVAKSQAGPTGCASAAASADKVSLASVTKDTFVCVFTTEGRLAEFRVVDVSGTRLSIAYTTWEREQ